jgi:hypothetical protein
VITKEQWPATRDHNIAFWRAWAGRGPQFKANDDLRRLLAQDIAAARHFGDTEAEQEFLKVDLDKAGTGDPEARAHNSLPVGVARRRAQPILADPTLN